MVSVKEAMPHSKSQKRRCNEKRLSCVPQKKCGAWMAVVISNLMAMPRSCFPIRANQWAHVFLVPVAFVNCAHRTLQNCISCAGSALVVCHFYCRKMRIARQKPFFFCHARTPPLAGRAIRDSDQCRALRDAGAVNPKDLGWGREQRGSIMVHKCHGAGFQYKFCFGKKRKNGAGV